MLHHTTCYIIQHATTHMLRPSHQHQTDSPSSIFDASVSLSMFQSMVLVLVQIPVPGYYHYNSTNNSNSNSTALLFFITNNEIRFSILFLSFRKQMIKSRATKIITNGFASKFIQNALHAYLDNSRNYATPPPPFKQIVNDPHSVSKSIREPSLKMRVVVFQ